MRNCRYIWGDMIIQHGCTLEEGHRLPHRCECGNKSNGTREERELGHAI